MSIETASVKNGSDTTGCIFFLLLFFELIIYSCGLQLDIHTLGNLNVLAKILLENLQEGTVISVEENPACIFYRIFVHLSIVIQEPGFVQEVSGLVCN